MDFFRQVERMIAFMDQEGEERTREMLDKADEEYNILVGKMVQAERTRINYIYKKKEDNVEMSRKVFGSVTRNEARLSLLRYRLSLADKLYGEINAIIHYTLQDPERRKTLLSDFLLQALCRIVEKRVGLRVCQQDLDLINEVIPSVQQRYHDFTTFTVDIVVDMNNYLSDDKLLGVYISTRKGLITLENSIATRMVQIRTKFSPVLRRMLFSKVALSKVTRFYYE